MVTWSWLPVLALISTAFVWKAGWALSQNASDADAQAQAQAQAEAEQLLAADNSTWWWSSKEAGGPNATARTNLTRMIDGGVDHADCFYFCPTWTNVFVIVLLILVLTCLCGAITQHQPREIWYVVDRSGEAPRVVGEPPHIPPRLAMPPTSQQQQQPPAQPQLRSPQP